LTANIIYLLNYLSFVLLVDVGDANLRVRGLDTTNTVFTDFTIDP